MDAIDLTKSDSDDEVRPVKRQRRSSPDDDVQVIEEPATRAPATAGPEPSLGDEDLLITRATGPVWNEDLPHTRSQCGKHTFLTSPSIGNSEHCSKCYCYICDVEADKCKQWGSGSISYHHCNAHGGQQNYRDMRTRALASPAVATHAPSAARSSILQSAVQRVRSTGPSSAAGPSAPATAERRQSSGPAGAVGPSAPDTQRRASIERLRAAPPHSRAACPVEPFQPSPSTVNRRSCSLCMCFICNDYAQFCKHWGTGEARVDHCNANPGEECYRLQREAFRRHPALKAQPYPLEMPWRAAPPPMLAGNPFHSDEDSEEEDKEFDPEREAMKVLFATGRRVLSDSLDSPRCDRPPRPKQPMQPVERSSLLPDPALDNKLLEIGTIRLPIKAKAPYTVADLQQRVVRDGIGSRIHEEYTHPTLITIHNILYCQMLELLPLLHLVHGCEPTPMRVRRVTIVSHDGGAKPLTIGVSVHKEAKISDVLAAVKQNPAASCKPGEELVMAYCAGEKEPFTKAYMLRDMSTKTHEHHAKLGYVAFRVPCLKPAKEDSKGWISPTRLVVYNRKPDPEREYPGWVATAHTLLLEVSGDLWKGGRSAEKQIAAMIATALAPHRKANASHVEPHDCFSLNRCCQSGYTNHGGKYDFSRAVQGHHEYPVSESISSGVMYLAAHWKPRGLDLYDTESWSQPLVHDSASPEIMAETERLIKEEEAAKKERKSREQRPKDLLAELSSTCRTYLPDQIKLAKRTHHTLKHPTAACKLAILCEEEAPKDCAVLQIQVFVYKTHGSFNRSFFQSSDTWLPVSHKERRQYPESKHCLKEVMEYFLMDDPVAKAMREELKACAEKMRGSAPYSVTALMKWLQAEERPEAPQPPGLTVDLHPYQRQSLRFMLDNEQGEGGHRRHFWVPYKTPSGFTFWWSPLFNRASREVPALPWGGFLAEEMGCGKTVEILALILSNPAPPNVASGTVLPDGYIVSRATLVVCAVSLVGQWMEEAKSKLNGSLRMYQYHGQGRNKDPVTLATSYDLVVTTYQTLGSDWRMYNKKGSNTDGRFKPLGQIKWHRVVLDESHTVKAGGTQQTAACCELKADRRWCCSGTPISTEVSEFVGQFKFLGCQPFDNKNYFGSHIKPAWAAGGWQTSGGAVNLLYALNRTLIRHTQQQRLGGATVCKLPEKTEEAIAVEFSEAEQRLYLRVHKEAKAEFQKYANRGSMTVARNLLAIMSLLSPLRAICSGGLLRERDVRVPNKDQEEQVPNGVDPNLVAPLEECSICLNHDMERPCRTPCLHWFCRECITAELAVREKCPLCRTELQVAQLVEGVSAAREEDEEVLGAAGGSAASQAVVSESKLRALLKELADMRERDPTAKALIFTQFNSTLEWLMARLTEEGYSYRTISGSMPLKKRSQAIDAFQRDPPTTVFLLSMRSGAVGINLTAANHVFILEPAMNPALEDQAVGRAFRMGQMRPVTVRKLYIKGSVEERIMELVKDRREGRATGAAAAVDEYDEDTGRRLQKSKMRQQDVAGSIRMDRQDLRMAELQLLFQDPEFTCTAGLHQAAACNAAPSAPACGGSA